jgi:hypothetical protein
LTPRKWVKLNPKVLPIRQIRSSALLALVVAGVLLFQFGAYDPGHDDDHGRHCCPACHAGHITATAETAVVVVIPPNEAHRYVPFETIQLAPEAAMIAGCSRAPPA